ncbi:MAG: thioredoxin family protein [Pseudomonadota bacterium]
MKPSKIIFRILGFTCVLLSLMVIFGCTRINTQERIPDRSWLTDFAQAQEAARSKNLPILAAFVGSDWCPWCEKLEEEIFSQRNFMDYAQSHFILFQADFPRHKAQPLPLKNQNEALSKTYAVSRFPTVLIIEPQGKEKARTGFRYGGVNAYIEYLNERLKDNGLLPNHKDPLPVSISP